MAANWLRSTLVVVLVVGMGQGFFLCRRGGGGGKGKICWKDQNFFKAPPVDHVNSK